MPKACRSCRQRKVRCDGQLERKCGQCVKHQLDCIYDDSKDRSSRLGAVRGNVIASCKLRSTSPSPQSTSSSHSDAFFYRLIPRWLTFIYPLCPVIDEEEIRHHVRQRHSEEDSAALMYAWAGVVVFQAHFAEAPEPDLAMEETSSLISLALERSQAVDTGSVTFVRLLVSLFLEWDMLALKRIESGFFYLRQSIALTQILQMRSHEEKLDQNRLGVIYWLCFIHERTLALMYKLPICLDPLPSFPQMTPRPLERGFHYTIRTFLLVDKPFLSAWRNDSSVTIDKGWIEKRHQELTDELWFSHAEQLPIVQQIDLVITRQWLCTLLWQMAISNVRLSSEAAPSTVLSLTMPLHILAQMKTLLSRTPPIEVTMHALSLVYRLFEITTTIADVLLLLPPCEDRHDTQRKIGDFLFAKDFLLSLPSVKPVYRDALMERLRAINEKYKLD